MNSWLNWAWANIHWNSPAYLVFTLYSYNCSQKYQFHKNISFTQLWKKYFKAFKIKYFISVGAQSSSSSTSSEEVLPSRFESVPPSFRSFSSKKKTKKTKKLPTYCVFCKVVTEYQLNMYRTLTDYLFTLSDTSDTCHNAARDEIISHANLNF